MALVLGSHQCKINLELLSLLTYELIWLSTDSKYDRFLAESVTWESDAIVSKVSPGIAVHLFVWTECRLCCLLHATVSGLKELGMAAIGVPGRQ